MKNITILRSKDTKIRNTSDRLLFFENLAVDSDIESYHFDSFLKMEEESIDFVNSQLPSIQIKNLIGNFIPIINKKPWVKAKETSYTFSTQFNEAIPYIYDEHKSKSVISKNQQINITGIKFNENTKLPYRNIESHLMKQPINVRAQIGNYGLYAWDNVFMQKKVIPLESMDLSIYFKSDKDALTKIEFLRKYIEGANMQYNNGLHFLTRYIRSKIVSDVKPQVALPVKTSKKNDLIKLLDTVYYGKITEYNMRMVTLFDVASGGLWDIYSYAKTQGLNKISILLNKKKEELKRKQSIRNARIYNTRKMSDHYMKLRIALDLFGKLNLDELNIKEHKIIDLTMKKNREIMAYSLSNKCKHITLLRQLMIPKHFREREKVAFEELKKIMVIEDKSNQPYVDGLMQCSICNLNVLCPHHYDMFESLSKNNEIHDIITHIVKKYSDATSLIENAYFCKICGEKLVQQIDEGNIEFVNNERINTLREIDNISSIVWREVRNIVMGQLMFNTLMDKKALVSTITDNIHSFIYSEVEKMKNIKTLGQDQIHNITNLYSAIYGYAQVIKLLSHHPEDLRFKYKIKGSHERPKCPQEMIEPLRILSRNYPDKELYRSLFCEGMRKLHKPYVTLDDIKYELPYIERSGLYKPTVHIGQRKLILSEVQFLTKYKTRYCIYAGAAPGHKNHLLSKLFPHVKFIMVDPNKFEIKITNRGRQTTHRKIKHDDIVHIYHEYPTKSNTWGDNTKVSQMTPTNIRKMISFIKSSTYKIFIIEDWYNINISEIFKNLSSKSFMSDIRSNVAMDTYPTDLDIIWNTSMMYNWIYTLNPEFSMIKFRLPFFNTPKVVETDAKNFFEEFEVSKKLGIDFIADYKQKKMACPKGDIYIQAWAGQSSTELRLHIKKEDIKNPKYYDFKKIENKLYYFNSISRGFYKHENANASSYIGFCHCNDCALENNIWEEYISKYRSHKTVLNYVKLVDRFTNRPLFRQHLLRIFEYIDTPEKILKWITNIKKSKLKKNLNFGNQKGNQGKDGGNFQKKKIASPIINLKYLQQLFSIALSKLLSSKGEIIQKISLISRDSIKPLLIKAFKDIQAPIQTVKFSYDLSAEYVVYSVIYRYLYKVHKKFDSKLKLEDVKRILGVELQQVPKLSNIVSSAIIPGKWPHITNKGAVFKNDLYTNYAYESFSHFINYVRNDLYMVPIFDNVSHMEHARDFLKLRKMEEMLHKYQYVYFRSQIFLQYYSYFGKYQFKEITLNKIFCKDGRKHIFNINIYGKVEVSPTNISKFILDPQKNREFLKMKRTDIKCSICNTLYSKLNATNENIRETLNSNYNINGFYNLYIFKCPVNNIHIWKNNSCIQCKVTKEMLFNKDLSYYNKYKSVFGNYIKNLKTEIKQPIKVFRETIQTYGEFVEDTSQIKIHHMAKLIGIPFSILENIGLIEGHYFEQVESGEFNPIEYAQDADHRKRTLLLSMYIRIFLIEYEMMKLDKISSPSLGKFIESQDIDSTNFPTLKNGYLSKFKYYSTVIPPFKLNNFILESLFDYLMFIMKNYKGKDDGAKKFIKYILNKIIMAEKNLSITNVITTDPIDYDNQGDSNEIANTETIEMEDDFYDPFNIDTFDLDKETYDDNIIGND